MSSMTRRAALAALGSVAMAPAAMAIKPITRSGADRLRLSLAAYSLRQPLSAKPGSAGAMNLIDFVDYAATLDLDAVELTSYFFPAEITPAYLSDLRLRCHHRGLAVSGGAIRNNFTLPAGDPKLDEWFAHVETWCKHYAALGALPIRVFAGVPPKGISEEQGIANAIENLKRACETAKKYGVILALENHDFLTKVDRMLPILEQVDSPHFGVNLDSGNIAGAEDPYAEMAKIAPYAVNAQIKVEVPVGKTRQPTDFARVIKVLRDADYRGYVVLEYESKEDPFKAIPEHLAALRKAIQ